MHLLLNKNIANLEFAASARIKFSTLCEPMQTSKECLVSAVEQLENDPAIDSLIYSIFKDFEMANYWIDFMSIVEILMMSFHAIHTCTVIGKSTSSHCVK